jgi:hypothetical protein
VREPAEVRERREQLFAARVEAAHVRVRPGDEVAESEVERLVEERDRGEARQPAARAAPAAMVRITSPRGIPLMKKSAAIWVWKLPTPKKSTKSANAHSKLSISDQTQ